MAVFEETKYGVQCDLCMKLYTNMDNVHFLFVDEVTAKKSANNDDWLIEQGICLCPECYEIDNKGNINIKEKERQYGSE